MRGSILESSRRYIVRKAINLLGGTVAVIAVISAIIPLGAMIYYVLSQGGPALNLDFFTKLPGGPGDTGVGMVNAILGTLLLIALSSLIGLPIGLLSGIYLARTRSGDPGHFAQIVRFFTDVIAGTPSIIAGVVAYAVVVIPMHRFSALAGGVALGLLMFPTVTRATEEAIKLVPSAVHEAALALGLPEWKAMLRIILPSAAAGVVTAIILGIARVAGETAPLLFTAFNNSAISFAPLQPVAALPYQIWTDAMSPYSDWHRQAWAGAFVLFSIVVILNLIARVLTRRLTAQTGQG
jgi:phosphate transport system permease protein